MKLELILEELNSFEKLPFLKTIDGFEPSSAKEKKEKEKILNQSDGQLKNADNKNVSKILNPPVSAKLKRWQFSEGLA